MDVDDGRFCVWGNFIINWQVEVIPCSVNNDYIFYNDLEFREPPTNPRGTLTRSLRCRNVSVFNNKAAQILADLEIFLFSS